MPRKLDPWTRIPREEFVERQGRARRAAQSAGLDGLIVYSRGGAFLDMHADVLYLTNHYSQLPYVADHFRVGSAISHAALLLPVDGPSLLVVDVPWWRDDLVVADEVRDSMDVTGAVGQALRDTGLYGRRVGLVGVEFMAASAYLGLLEVAGDTRIERRDDLIERLRLRASRAEQALIREAAAVGSRVVEAVMDAAAAGGSEGDAVRRGVERVVAEGAVLYDVACGSGHHYAWSRLPSWETRRPLETGDMLHVDCYGVYGGYLWDFGRTRVIGDRPTEAQYDFMEAAIQGVQQVCGNIRPGVTGDDIYRSVEGWLGTAPQAQRLRKRLPDFSGFAHVGHGIGLSWSAPWLMKGDRTVLEPGMYLAVEMLISQPGIGAALFEENGLVTEAGFEVLTTTRTRWHPV